MNAVDIEGRVNIPRTLQDARRMRPGTALEFGASKGTLVARKVETDSRSGVFGWLCRASGYRQIPLRDPRRSGRMITGGDSRAPGA